MKKYISISSTSLLILFFLVSIQGCMKDTCRQTYKIYKPVFKPLSEVRAEMKSGPAQQLKNTGKLNLFGNYIFLNEINKGIHVIDNSNPAAPKNIAFINIQNNVDLAIKGSYLYADSYSDIVVFDISNPTNIQPVKFMNNVIKEQDRYWFNNNPNNLESIRVIIGYTEKDTIVDCSTYDRWTRCNNCTMGDMSGGGGGFATAAPPTTGIGGSMARFTIVNNYLYAVSNSDLHSISLANPANPEETATTRIGWNIETIYPFQSTLFIGSMQGMFIYGLSNPAIPNQLGQFQHVRTCDPVIADGQHAYVTLRGGTTCGGFTNQLEVLDIADLSAPVLKKTVPLTNPHGLSKDGNLLFICDGPDGLKVYDVTNPIKPTFVKQVIGLETYDVIALSGRLIVVAKDGLYQYSYSTGQDIQEISKISIVKD